MACATYIKVEQYIEFANGVHNLHQGANGAHTGKRKLPRFPFPRCSGYGKRECAVPLGLGASPSRGSLRGKAKDRAYNWIFFETNWKKLEKIGKYFQKIGPSV